MRKLLALGTFLSLIAPLTTAQVSATSIHPNPQANQLCGFGPGSVRWPIKTSVPAGESPANVVAVDIRDFVQAPDLQESSRSRAAVASAFQTTRQAMINPNYVLPQAQSPLVTSARWFRYSTNMPASPPFNVTMPPITPPLVAQTLEIARMASETNEGTPSLYHALLSTQVSNSRIPQPVEIGGRAFHEGDFISTTGVVRASTCEKDDGDFHVDLSASDSGPCAVVEVPNPYYIGQAGLKTRVADAEIKAKQLSVGETITVAGQLFYDTAHGGSPGGGRGVEKCATSLWEIHPVFALEVSG